MGIIIDFIAASSSKNGFKEGWKRIRCIRKGHNFNNSTLIDKLKSENHPENDDDFIFTVNIYRCKDCGCTYKNSGMEFRKRWFRYSD